MAEQISYPNAITLMEHIVNMGEGSASWNRQYFVGVDTFLAAAALYQGRLLIIASLDLQVS
jgi:hypothetical protein